MLRLELEAQVANAQAEVGSMEADAAIEEGRSLAPADVAGPDAAASDVTEVTDEADEADEAPAT
jgi:hypothetical protein